MNKILVSVVVAAVVMIGISSTANSEEHMTVAGEKLDNGLGSMVYGEKLDSGLGDLKPEDLKKYLK